EHLRSDHLSPDTELLLRAIDPVHSVERERAVASVCIALEPRGRRDSPLRQPPRGGPGLLRRRASSHGRRLPMAAYTVRRRARGPLLAGHARKPTRPGARVTRCWDRSARTPDRTLG